MPSVYFYLLINILTIAAPLVWSFEPNMRFIGHWRYLWPAIGITALLFLVWDVIFTYLGFWGFTSNYLTGIYIFNLPIEEVLFFITVPYACMFIYETVYFLWRDKIKKGIFYQLSLVACVFLFFVGIINYDKWYTVTACIGACGLLAYHIVRKKQINHEVFWVSYMIILFPFTVVNGILTGFATEQPIVWYNNNENLGIRFLTIPVEDFAYNLLLLLLNVTLYERWNGRLYSKNPS